jgi:hypothetical protein
MKTQWITHKGKRILLADYSNFAMDIEGAKAEMLAAVNLAKREPPNSVLTLTDVRGTKGSPDMVNLMKDTATKIAPYARKRAVVGVGGIQRTFLDLINKVSGAKTLVAFDDLEKAKDWLVTD